MPDLRPFGPAVASLFLASSEIASVEPTDDQRVNPVLIEHQATLVRGLKQLGGNVHGAQFLGYSNFGLIDNGPMWTYMDTNAL